MNSHTVLGTCHHDCPDSCGWVATVQGDVVVKLRGNPEHPFSRGELCPKVNRFVDRVYDPDRLLNPLIRSGEKGSGQFQKVGWDEALELVANRVGDAIEEYGGETVLPWWDAGTQGLIQESSLDRRFFAKLGASRRIGSLCGASAGHGIAATYGSSKCADPMMLRHAKLVILWATNTRLTNRHLWPFVEEARSNGAQIIVIDTIRTATAQAADRFVQPLPGTDTALMLAMMHILIRDDLIDRDYIDSHAEGFAELAAHVVDWTPDRAAVICGVSVQEIEDLATAYGTASPANIATLIGAEHHENGAMFFRTLACLPVLTGSWRHTGGGMSKSVAPWFASHVDFGFADRPNLAGGKERRGVNMNHLGRALTELDDPPVTVLFSWNGNPAVTVPNSGLVRQGLMRDDLFTVVSEQFMTDTARHADVVFPAATQLEQLDVVPAWGHLYLGWNEPAIDPLGDCVPNTELFRRLSQAMGFTEPELFEDDQSLIASALHDLDMAKLRTDGFVSVGNEETGPYRDGNFGSPSGKALLFSQSLADQGHGALPTFTASNESPVGNPELAKRYPLMLATPKQHTRFLNSSYSALPKHGPLEGGPFVELDAADAKARGLDEGDKARIWNDRGSLILPVRISDRLRPGLTAIPFGWWSQHYEGEESVNVLTNDTLTDWGGGVAYSDTLVQVAEATAPTTI